MTARELRARDVVVELDGAKLAAMAIRDGWFPLLTGAATAVVDVAPFLALRLEERIGFGAELTQEGGARQARFTGRWRQAIYGDRTLPDVELSFTTQVVDELAAGEARILLELTGSTVELRAGGAPVTDLAELRAVLWALLRDGSFTVTPGRLALVRERIGSTVNLILVRWAMAGLTSTFLPRTDGSGQSALALVMPMRLLMPTFAVPAAGTPRPLALANSSLRPGVSATVRLGDELFLDLALRSTLLSTLRGLTPADLLITDSTVALAAGRRPAVDFIDGMGRRAFGLVIDSLSGAVSPPNGVALTATIGIRFLPQLSGLEWLMDWAIGSSARVSAMILPSLASNSLVFTMSTSVSGVSAWITFWGYLAIAAIFVAFAVLIAATGGAATAGAVAVAAGLAALTGLILTGIADGLLRLIVTLLRVGLSRTDTSPVMQGVPLPPNVARAVGPTAMLAATVDELIVEARGDGPRPGDPVARRGTGFRLARESGIDFDTDRVVVGAAAAGADLAVATRDGVAVVLAPSPARAAVVRGRSFGSLGLADVETALGTGEIVDALASVPVLDPPVFDGGGVPAGSLAMVFETDRGGRGRCAAWRDRTDQLHLIYEIFRAAPPHADLRVTRETLASDVIASVPGDGETIVLSEAAFRWTIEVVGFRLRPPLACAWSIDGTPIAGAGSVAGTANRVRFHVEGSTLVLEADRGTTFSIAVAAVIRDDRPLEFRREVAVGSTGTLAERLESAPLYPIGKIDLPPSAELPAFDPLLGDTAAFLKALSLGTGIAVEKIIEDPRFLD